MKCKICDDREMAHGAEQGTGLCNFCWEMKSRMEADPELAGKILRVVLIDRSERSSLGSLRDDLIGYVARLQAREAAEEGEEVLAWVDILVDGVRGLAHYTDEELLQEFEGLKDADEAGPLLQAQLAEFPAWKEILEDSKERKTPEMADWQTKIDLEKIWPKDDETPDVKQIATEIARQLRGLDLGFLTTDDPYRQMASELADDFEELASQEDPDVEDFDDLMEALYNWADTAVTPGTGASVVPTSGRKKMCWIATHL